MFIYSIIKQNKIGFLLVEAMLIITIVSIGLVIVVHSLLSSIKAVNLNNDYTLASLLLQQRLWDFEQGGEISKDLEIEENFPEPYEKFKFKLSSQNLTENNEVASLNEVKASVSWSSKQREKSISITTYLKNIQE